MTCQSTVGGNIYMVCYLEGNMDVVISECVVLRITWM